MDFILIKMFFSIKKGLSMNIFQIKRRCALFISLSLMFPPSFLLPEPRHIENLSHEETRIVLEDSHNQYVDLSKDASNIYDVIVEISLLDDNQNSPIHALRKHIESESSIGEMNEVGLAFEYGKSVITKKRNLLKKALLKSFMPILTQLFINLFPGILLLINNAQQ